VAADQWKDTSGCFGLLVFLTLFAFMFFLGYVVGQTAEADRCAEHLEHK
jgi:hypothetical protein